MSISQVSHRSFGQIAIVEAEGGNRRERGSAIAAYARKRGFKRLSGKPQYSETYGFQTQTTIRYQIRSV